MDSQTIHNAIVELYTALGDLNAALKYEENGDGCRADRMLEAGRTRVDNAARMIREGHNGN